MPLSKATRIDCLSKDNYDAWKLQVRALLIKNDAWGYVNGDIKPEGAFDAEWTKNDSKAQSDIILSMGDSELKQVKGCTTSRELWLKLESIYQSTGPARKAALLTKLTLSRAEEGSDIRAHVNNFHDTVDKLAEMNIEVHPDLLSVLLLSSLSNSFEKFRYAVKSRDVLPAPETLRIKTLGESDSRENSNEGCSQEALFSGKNHKRNHANNNNNNNYRERKDHISKSKNNNFRFM